MDRTDVLDLMFHALVYATDGRIADVTRQDDGILLTTTDGTHTQAWRISQDAIAETAPVEDVA